LQKGAIVCECIPSPERKITSGPRHGEMISVEIPTTIHAVLEFADGALVTLGASRDVKAHGHRPMEVYATDATLIVADPNFLAATFRGLNRAARQGSCRPGAIPSMCPISSTAMA
jgi:predicted dehydrogenase